MQNSIDFLFDELITCGCTLSAFELCEALREQGQECNIVSKHPNKELEDYFKIESVRKKIGTTITFTPKLVGDYAYVRTKDGRWLNHQEPIIAVSKYIKDWIGGSVIGNGTHKRFKNLNIERDIDILIEGNHEPNKNIEETIKEAKKLGKNIVWFGRHTIPVPGVHNITNPSIESIPQLYNRSKVLLKMSKNEGWSRPIAEATQCGCKVINKNGGNKEIEIVSWESIAKQLLEYLNERL